MREAQEIKACDGVKVQRARARAQNFVQGSVLNIIIRDSPNRRLINSDSGRIFDPRGHTLLTCDANAQSDRSLCANQEPMIVITFAHLWPVTKLEC